MSSATTSKKGVKKVASVASNGKLKQASLMSFFSKSKAPEPSEPSSEKSEDALPSPVSSSPGPSAISDTEDLTVTKVETKIAGTPVASSKNRLASTVSQTPVSMEKKETKNLNNEPQSSPIVARKNKKRIDYAENDSDEDEDIVLSTQKKRKTAKAIVESDDDDVFEAESESSEDEEDDDDDFIVPDDAEEDEAVVEDVDDDDLEIFEEVSKPKKTKVKSSKVNVTPTKTAVETSSFKSSNLASKFGASSSYVSSTTPAKKATPSSNGAISPPKKNFAKANEERYKWLVEIRDADGHLEQDPEYDPRTLYIPKSAWAGFTPFEKQYWEIKSKMYDCVVFFKKGKFYELYEKDADIAHDKFDLKLAGGGRANMRLAGIPEMSFDYWASKFIDAGFKVAKVNQNESMLAKEIREKGKTITREEKIIKRELSCVLTAGTLTEETMLTDDMGKYCLAIKECTNPDGSKVFGVAFVDTATGAIQLTEIEDDSECGKLETLLAQIRPTEILAEKSNISSSVVKMLKFNSAPGSLWNFLKPGNEFLDYDSTWEELTRGKYFLAENLDDYSNYPKILVDYQENHHVGFSAFGALMWYLKSLKLDKPIISMGNITRYDAVKKSTHMTLDGVTLQNLEIFANSFDGSDKGTLFKLLNRAITPFGKRQFKRWIFHPLFQQKQIEDRLDSVDVLLNDGDLRYVLESTFSKIPDLERLLARIHGGTLQVKDFSRVIEGFESIAKLVRSLKESYGESFESISGALGTTLCTMPPNLEVRVNAWTDAFDRELAVTQNVIVPERGVEEEFDASLDKIKGLEESLEALVRQYRREYKSQEICYRDSGKEIYLIEVPVKVASKVPKDWQQMASTSKVKRYWSPEVKTLVRELMEARELHKILMESLQGQMYARFDEDYETLWAPVVRCVAALDCIISLTRASESLGTCSSRPVFVNSTQGMIDFKDLRHPCFTPGGASGTHDFIPNDISLGVDNSAKVSLLTGANAAGKSTLLRMSCIAVVMAQIGCYVPASSARLTPIDRIMTRLGANDNIMQGKSTFFVELSETKRMLDTATPRSLLVLDELGRGGSSSDGFAIAEAVLHHIATHIQSLGFFATHYGTLGASFRHHPRVKPQRMAILVDEESKNITFLYKLEAGASLGSFGMHVASMCGIDRKIVDVAEEAAKEMEHTSKLKKAQAKVSGDELALVPLGLQSDFASLLKGDFGSCQTEEMKMDALTSILTIIGQI